MRRIILLLFLFSFQMKAQNKRCSPLPEAKPDFYTLDQRDLFIITEYKETEYQVFLDRDSLNLPANLSSVNYYVDINDQTDSSNIVDINYLYLQGYHEKTKTGGELFYLLTTKHIPMGNRKTNIRSSKTVDLYSELSSVIDMSFGYWQIDTITHRVFIIFRDRTHIWNMNNFRVFAGLILNKNIYLTKAMNTKDDYLFDYNFKKNKEVFVKLPLSLDRVFYSEPMKTEDTTGIKRATLSRIDAEKEIRSGKNSNPKKEMLDWLQKNKNPVEEEVNQKQTSKITEPVKDQAKNDKTFNAAIKYSYYPFNKKSFDNRKIECLNYDSLSFAFLKRKNGKRASKNVLFKARKGNLFTYSKINLRQYKRYYSEANQKEYIFIHILDPYDEKIVHTFSIPYSGENFIPHIIYFFRKKILDS